MPNGHWIVTPPNGLTYTVWAHSKAGAIDAARFYVLTKTDEGWGERVGVDYGCVDVRPVA